MNVHKGRLVTIVRDGASVTKSVVRVNQKLNMVVLEDNETVTVATCTKTSKQERDAYVRAKQVTRAKRLTEV